MREQGKKQDHNTGLEKIRFWLLQGPAHCPWDKALKGRGTKEIWLTFRVCLLQAQEQVIRPKG